jgi:hypothetical protein
MRKSFPFVTSSVVTALALAAAAWAADYNTAVKQTPLMNWTGRSPAPELAQQDPAVVAKLVDKLLVEDVAAADSGTKVIQVSHRASDEVFLRRVYLDLIGRNPTPEEVTAYVLDPSAEKRGKLVDRLLDDSHFGDNWGRYWRDVIMYHRSDDRAQLAAEPLFEYLRDEFNKNAPWDQIVRSFITAKGDVRENGATGLIMAQNGNTADITSEVSRIFLGVQIQCANCHDHKTDRWKREQFHQLAAFFPRIRLAPSQPPQPAPTTSMTAQSNMPKRATTPAQAQKAAAGGMRTFIVSSNDLPFQRLNAKNADKPIGAPEHLMPDLKHPELPGTRMQPVFFLTGQKLDFGTPDEKRRDSIAFWITASTNEWFAKAFVNRLWSELVGEGFYEPIDDIGPDRTCSAPKTMDCLAHEFADSRFDIKRLYRIITATDAYQRESKTRRNPDDLPFLANCPQRLRGDQLYDSLVAALGMNEFPRGPLARMAAAGAGAGKGYGQRGQRNQFDQVFGYDPSTPRDEVSGSIPQALLMMNGAQINRSINGYRRDTELGRLLVTTTNDDSVATEIYLNCFGREPNQAELATCLTHVKNCKTRAEGFEDILWALVNSTEFLHRK